MKISKLHIAKLEYGLHVGIRIKAECKRMWSWSKIPYEDVTFVTGRGNPFVENIGSVW